VTMTLSLSQLPANAPEMNPSVTKHVPHLDGWRGLAIVLVLFSHFVDTELQRTGGFGVLLFFVLSGFLMSQLLFIKKVDLKDFFVRRFSRIAPTFWLYTLTIAVYAATVQPSIYRVPFGEIASTLTFLRTYIPADRNIWADQWPIGHLWSLNVEEHFYVFLAVGALCCRRIRNDSSAVVFLLTSTATALAITFFYAANPPGGATPWHLRTECAALGLVAASALRITREQSSPWWTNKVQSWLPVVTLLNCRRVLEPVFGTDNARIRLEDNVSGRGP
jgi:peptidoglycan/LPS O-acetylase OafA/YrhL